MYQIGMWQDIWDFFISMIYKALTALMDVLVNFATGFLQQTSAWSNLQAAISSLPPEIQWVFCLLGFVKIISVLAGGYLMRLSLRMIPIPMNPFR